MLRRIHPGIAENPPSSGCGPASELEDFPYGLVCIVVHESLIAVFLSCISSSVYSNFFCLNLHLLSHGFFIL
jgi:hypothetical protein